MSYHHQTSQGIVLLCILLAGSSAFLTGCGKSPTTADSWKPEPGMEIAEEKDEFGYLSRYQQRPDGTREGPFEQFDSSGTLYQRANYNNGQLHGQRVIFFPSGDTVLVETYEDGQFEGPFIEFYENGEKKAEGSYHENTMRGPWRRFYDTGALMEEVTFEDNFENGPFVEYYANGNLKAEGTYLDGDNEHGLLLLYDESGELERRMECEKGICHTKWKAE